MFQLRKVFLLWLFLPSIQPTVWAGELAILPNESDYAAHEAGEHCSVLRAVLRRAETEQDETAREREDYKLVLRQSRDELEACAHREGASLARDPRSQALLAEVCSIEYESWLHAGAHYRLLREDSETATGSMQLLVAHARGRCGALPTPPAFEVAERDTPIVERGPRE